MTLQEFSLLLLVIFGHILSHFWFPVPWLSEIFLSQTDGIGEEKPLVQAVENFSSMPH